MGTSLWLEREIYNWSNQEAQCFCKDRVLRACDFTTWYIQNIPIKIKCALKDNSEHNSADEGCQEGSLVSLGLSPIFLGSQLSLVLTTNLIIPASFFHIPFQSSFPTWWRPEPYITKADSPILPLQPTRPPSTEILTSHSVCQKHPLHHPQPWGRI